MGVQRISQNLSGELWHKFPRKHVYPFVVRNFASIPVFRSPKLPFLLVVFAQSSLGQGLNFACNYSNEEQGQNYLKKIVPVKHLHAKLRALGDNEDNGVKE